MGNQLAEKEAYLTIYRDEEDVFKALADEIVDLITVKNKRGEEGVIVFPVGPKGHYPYMVERIIAEDISLEHMWFINMDEYLTDEKEWIATDHELSFRKFMNEQLYDLIPSHLLMPKEQRIFPDPDHLNLIPNLIDEKGLDLVIGGIGINGHVAFNEPQDNLSPEEFRSLKTRVLRIDEVTRAVNSIGDLAGFIQGMPKYCVTIGFYEMLKAKRIRLGVFRDWHKGVLRTFLANQPTSTFPVTLFKGHDDFNILVPSYLDAEEGESHGINY